MLVVDYTTPGKIRACARFDADRVAAAIAAGKTDAGGLLGRGHLALTIDQGPDMSRYQGLVALDGRSFEDAAHEYFLRSEQIPTRIRLAVGEELSAAVGGAQHRWRAGGLLVQFLPKAPERARQPDLDPGDAPAGKGAQDFAPMPCPRTTPGSKAARWSRRSRTSSSSIRRCRPSGWSIACSMSAACGCSPTRRCRPNAHARARTFPICSRASRRTIATTWSRTASSPSPASSAIRAMRSSRTRSRANCPPTNRARQAAQLSVRPPCGMSSENAGISMSNGSPASVTMP